MANKIEHGSKGAVVCLPKETLKIARMRVGDPVSISAQKGVVVINAIDEKTNRTLFPFSESELLEGLNAYGAHANELVEPSPVEVGI